MMKKRILSVFLIFSTIFYTGHNVSAQFISTNDQYLLHEVPEDLKQHNNIFTDNHENIFSEQKKQQKHVRSHKPYQTFVEQGLNRGRIEKNALLRMPPQTQSALLSSVYTTWHPTITSKLQEIRPKKKVIGDLLPIITTSIEDLEKLQTDDPDLKSLYAKYKIVNGASQNRMNLADKIRADTLKHLSTVNNAIEQINSISILRILAKYIDTIIEAVADNRVTRNALNKIKALKAMLDKEEFKIYVPTMQKRKAALDTRLQNAYAKAKAYKKKTPPPVIKKETPPITPKIPVAPPDLPNKTETKTKVEPKESPPKQEPAHSIVAKTEEPSQIIPPPADGSSVAVPAQQIQKPEVEPPKTEKTNVEKVSEKEEPSTAVTPKVNEPPTEVNPDAKQPTEGTVPAITSTTAPAVKEPSAAVPEAKETPVVVPGEELPKEKNPPGKELPGIKEDHKVVPSPEAEKLPIPKPEKLADHQIVSSTEPPEKQGEVRIQHPDQKPADVLPGTDTDLGKTHPGPEIKNTEELAKPKIEEPQASVTKISGDKDSVPAPETVHEKDITIPSKPEDTDGAVQSHKSNEGVDEVTLKEPAGDMGVETPPKPEEGVDTLETPKQTNDIDALTPAHTKKEPVNVTPSDVTDNNEGVVSETNGEIVDETHSETERDRMITSTTSNSPTPTLTPAEKDHPCTVVPSVKEDFPTIIPHEEKTESFEKTAEYSEQDSGITAAAEITSNPETQSTSHQKEELTGKHDIRVHSQQINNEQRKINEIDKHLDKIIAYVDIYEKKIRYEHPEMAGSYTSIVHAVEENQKGERTDSQSLADNKKESIESHNSLISEYVEIIKTNKKKLKQLNQDLTEIITNSETEKKIMDTIFLQMEKEDDPESYDMAAKMINSARQIIHELKEIKGKTQKLIYELTVENNQEIILKGKLKQSKSSDRKYKLAGVAFGSLLLIGTLTFLSRSFYK